MAAGYGSDIANAWVADFLAYLANSPVQDAAAMIAAWQARTGIALPLVLAVTPRNLGGQDAIGAVATANPTVIAGLFSGTNVVRPFRADNVGNAFAILQGNDDVLTPRAAMVDRNGILAVAPPVSKLWAKSVSVNGAGTPSVTQAAPGAGLRNVCLAWGISIACGATALAPSNPGFAGITGFGTIVAMACPVNDCRIAIGNGPILGDANTAMTISGPAQPAGAMGIVYMVGYIAAFP